MIIFLKDPLTIHNFHNVFFYDPRTKTGDLIAVEGAQNWMRDELGWKKNSPRPVGGAKHIDQPYKGSVNK